MTYPAIRRVLLPTLAVVASTVGLQAGDDLVIDGVPAEPPAETVRFAPVVIRNLGGRVLGGPAASTTEYDLAAVFDQHVFRRPAGRQRVRLVNGRLVVEGGAASLTGETLEQLAYLRPLAERRIEMLDRICLLSESQRDRLRLAAESDLKRLAAEIDVVRRGYLGQRLPSTPQGVDRERLQAVRDDAVTCRHRIDQAFKTGSLLGSVGLGVLSDAQRTTLGAHLAARRKTRWEAMVRTVLDQLDESVLGFSARQHDELVGRLLADVPPLESFAEAPEVPTSSRTSDFQMLLVISRLKQLDQAALRRLCDPRQWAALEQLMSQQAPPAAIEELLVAQGVLEEEGVWPE